MKKINLQKGSSTLEILIAFVILIFAITAVIVIGFGNQSVSADSETNNEALYKAKQILEDARVQSREDFNSLVSILNDDSTYGINYEGSLDIVDISPCLKQASSTVTWEISPLRTQTISIATFLGSVTESLSLGGDCDTEIPDEWDNPITATSIGIGGQGATDIDVRGSVVYLTSAASAEAKDDLFIYTFDESAMDLIEESSLNLGMGINDIDVVDGYAFLANGSTTNTQSSDELLVLDVSDLSAPNVVARRTLGIVPNCPQFCPGGAQAIYFYENRIYLGTHRIGSSPGHEFYIFDVSTPSNPTLLRSAEINHNINDIVVRGDYAYLATSDNAGEILIYNISDPGPISFVGRFNANRTGPAQDVEDVTNLYLIGNKLYFGRDRVNNANERDFYVLDISNPTLPVELGSKNLNMSNNTSVKGVVVRGRLAFIAMDNPTTGFQILNISNPSNITDHPICTTYNFSENTSALDMEGNYIFTANDSNNEIRVIKDDDSLCTP